jgi:hypothetical protein
MTYTIKNTLNGRTVRDGVTGKPRTFSTEAEAKAYAAQHLCNNQMQAAFSLKSTKFAYTVVGA